MTVRKEKMCASRVQAFATAETLLEWESVTKDAPRACKAHSRTVYHVFNGL